MLKYPKRDHTAVRKCQPKTTLTTLPKRGSPYAACSRSCESASGPKTSPSSSTSPTTSATNTRANPSPALRYIRGKQGPVAEDDAIIKQLGCLVKDGLVCKAPDPFAHDALSHHYWVENPSDVWQEVKAAVGMGPDQFIIGIVMEYGSISSDSDIAAISKNTSAYKNASPAEHIQFKQRERAIYLQNKLRSHPKFPEFAAGVRRGFADMEAGNWVSDEDLMAELFDDQSPVRGD